MSKATMDGHRRTAHRTARRELAHLFLQEGVEAGLRRFRELHRESPQVLGESLTNLLGYFLLAESRVAEAIEIFRHNVEVHPRSSNAHHSLAEAYLQAGDLEAAAGAYRRSIELDGCNLDSRWMLAQLARPN